MKNYPVTPDGRYFVVKERLWRCTNPYLSEEERHGLVQDLMKARRAVRLAMQVQDVQALKNARETVNCTKIALGERGAVWWNDGAPDCNRKSVRTSPYASWYTQLKTEKM
jgi:hypothetical protein